MCDSCSLSPADFCRDGHGRPRGVPNGLRSAGKPHRLTICHSFVTINDQDLSCVWIRRVGAGAQFLEDTSAFYAREAQRWVQEDGLPDYLVKVSNPTQRCFRDCSANCEAACCQAEHRLKLERERVSNYLHSSTEEKLLKVGVWRCLSHRCVTVLPRSGG